MELKEITYVGNGPEFNGKVIYLLDAYTIYFCGITPHSTSTINAAERVIQAIANDLGINYLDYEFIDIQTWHQYGSKKRGEFDADQLKFVSMNSRPYVHDWVPFSLPEAILNVFKQFIS